MRFIKSILVVMMTFTASAALADTPKWQNPDDDDGPAYRGTQKNWSDDWDDRDDRRDPRYQQQYDFRNMGDLYRHRGDRVIRECRPFLFAQLGINQNRFNNPIEGRPDRVQSAPIKLRLIHSIKRKKFFYCQYAVAGDRRYETVLEYRMRCRGAKRDNRRGRFSCKWG